MNGHLGKHQNNSIGLGFQIGFKLQKSDRDKNCARTNINSKQVKFQANSDSIKREKIAKEAKLERLPERKLTFSNIPGLADCSIHLVTVIVREHNDHQSDRNNKICLTEEIVFKLTGSNRKAIARYLKENRNYIDYLNSKHNLTEDNNNKGKDFDFKEFLGINN